MNRRSGARPPSMMYRSGQPSPLKSPTVPPPSISPPGVSSRWLCVNAIPTWAATSVKPGVTAVAGGDPQARTSSTGKTIATAFVRTSIEDATRKSTIENPSLAGDPALVWCSLELSLLGSPPGYEPGTVRHTDSETPVVAGWHSWDATTRPQGEGSPERPLTSTVSP